MSTPCVLVHGYGDDNRNPLWGRCKEHLSSFGFTDFHQVDLGLLGTTTDNPRKYGSTVKDYLRRVSEDYGESVNVIAHSMGGISSRWAIEKLGADRYVDTAVLMGSPHDGTRVASLMPATSGARELERGSDTVTSLGAAPTHTDYVTVYSEADNLIMPKDSATIDGATNIRVNGYSHVELISRRPVINKYVSYLKR